MTKSGDKVITISYGEEATPKTEPSIQELRDWAAELMGWKHPTEQMPPGKYETIRENREFDIGPIVGYRHAESDTYYTLKDMDNFQYWLDKDGEPARTPWGELLSANNYYKWRPDDSDTGQIWLVVEQMRDRFGLVLYLTTLRDSRYCCGFSSPYGPYGIRTYSDSGPLAILKAAYATGVLRRNYD